MAVSGSEELPKSQAEAQPTSEAQLQAPRPAEAQPRHEKIWVLKSRSGHRHNLRPQTRSKDQKLRNPNKDEKVHLPNLRNVAKTPRSQHVPPAKTLRLYTQKPQVRKHKPSILKLWEYSHPKPLTPQWVPRVLEPLRPFIVDTWAVRKP